MNKLFYVLLGGVVLGLWACSPQAGADDPSDGKDVVVVVEPERDENGKIVPVEKTDAQWQDELSEDEYRILRHAGTERAFTGRYWDNKAQGVYACAGCGLLLFDSDTKFKSGTGWPSFFQPVGKDHVVELRDTSHGTVRVESLCGRCGGHLGHVFNDGPAPTGLRYCMNGGALRFVEQEPPAEAEGE